MRISCPKCQSEFAATDVNVKTDMAYCRGCQQAYRLSELMGGIGPPPALEDPTLSPPPGCWYRETANGWEAGATTRSWGALFLVPFMCVWSGFSLLGIYGTQIAKHQFNLGMTLFGIPFILFSLFFWAIALMLVAGKVIVRRYDDQLEFFTGLGGIGHRTMIPTDGLKSVLTSRIAYRRGTGSRIFVGGHRNFIFGSQLTLNRQCYLVNVLRFRLGVPASPDTFQEY